MKSGTRTIVAAAAVVIGLGAWNGVSSARSTHSRTVRSRAAARKTAASSTRTKALKVKPALPRFLPVKDIKTLRELRLARPRSMPDPLAPVLAPQLSGKMPKNLRDLPLLAGDRKFTESDFQKVTRSAAQRRAARRTSRSVPSFPVSIAPARITTGSRPITPRWVRYPLEFQLAGVGLGTLAVNKDRFNRIDRYGLFAMHGNPTAIVTPLRVPEATAGAGAGGAGAGGSGAPGAASGTVGGTADAPGTLTVQQQPPEFSPRFAQTQNGSVPAWANACIVDLDPNHVEWLYNRGTYAMGFVVDRLGYVDGIVVAGIQSDIANTQLEDPEHTIKLGDDLRKVLFRYGYPDSFTTYLVTISGGQASAGGAAPAGGAGGAPGAAPGAAGAGAAGSGTTNNLNRIFEVRYEQSYNVVFTISYNRVVRIYIFGDPDYFTEARRNRLRTQY